MKTKKSNERTPRGKPLALPHLTPEEAIMRAFNAGPAPKDGTPPKPLKKAK
jgi:hypothetical protein